MIWRSCHLAGEMLYVYYFDCSFLVVINFRVLCRSAGKVASQVHRGEDTTTMEEEVGAVQ